MVFRGNTVIQINPTSATLCLPMGEKLITLLFHLCNMLKGKEATNM
jgi:hypothetical protein